MIGDEAHAKRVAKGVLTIDEAWDEISYLRHRMAILETAIRDITYLEPPLGANDQNRRILNSYSDGVDLGIQQPILREIVK